MPVLIRLTTKLRPGNRLRAIPIPSGIPSSRESRVAAPDIWSESRVIPSTSESAVRMSLNACLIPSQMSSTSASDLFFPLPRDRHEQRLPVFFQAETLDRSLSFRSDHKIGEGLSSNDIDPRAVGWIHLHDRIDVEERFVSLEENGERQPFLIGEIGCAVGNRVGVPVVSDAERRSHSLTRLDVPGTFRLDPCLFPKRLLNSVRA